MVRGILEMCGNFKCCFFIFSVIMAVSTVTEACGTYVEIASGGTSTLTSGSNYGHYVNCIWWVETKAGYQLSMALTYEGDYHTSESRCGDYILIDDGTGNVLFDGSSDANCQSSISEDIKATASWMKVQFKSDGANTTSGFQGVITSLKNSSISQDNPIEDCRSYQWSCPNKVCMTLSYRCDGFNDCGCDGDGCDESGCHGLPLGKYTIMLVGGFIGFGVFLFFFFFAFAYESHLRRKALLADPEAQAELQKKKSDQKRRAAYKKAAKEKKDRR